MTINIQIGRTINAGNHLDKIAALLYLKNQHTSKVLPINVGEVNQFVDEFLLIKFLRLVSVQLIKTKDLEIVSTTL
jgi:hypothetical protein